MLLGSGMSVLPGGGKATLYCGSEVEEAARASPVLFLVQVMPVRG